MIPANCERVGDVPENAARVVENFARPPMNRLRRANNRRPQCRRNRLMPQTNAEQGDPLVKLPNNIH